MTLAPALSQNRAMSASLALTITTNEDPLVLTKAARIVSMNVRDREHIQFRGRDYKLVLNKTSDVILPLTVIMTLRFTMSGEDYLRFLRRIGENSFLLLAVDAGEGLTLTRNAMLVEVTMCSRPPLPVDLTMTLHGDMTREDYDKFETLILTTACPDMIVDIDHTRDGHFRAHFKTKQGDRQ